MNDIPEFHGNPNDLDWNPEFVFNLKAEMVELKDLSERRADLLLRTEAKLQAEEKAIVGCVDTISTINDICYTQQADIMKLADNLLCAGEVIKRTNSKLGAAYKVLANEYLGKE